jgi:hypothetical protein
LRTAIIARHAQAKHLSDIPVAAWVAGLALLVLAHWSFLFAVLLKELLAVEAKTLRARHSIDS